MADDRRMSYWLIRLPIWHRLRVHLCHWEATHRRRRLFSFNIRPHRIHKRRTIEPDDPGHLSVCHATSLCKNGWNDRGPVRVEIIGGARNITLHRRPDFTHGFDAAFAKLLWLLVIHLQKSLLDFGSIEMSRNLSFSLFNAKAYMTGYWPTAVRPLWLFYFWTNRLLDWLQDWYSQLGLLRSSVIVTLYSVRMDQHDIRPLSCAVVRLALQQLLRSLSF